MDSEGAWEETKRKVKPFNQDDDYDPSSYDLKGVDIGFFVTYSLN